MILYIEIALLGLGILGIGALILIETRRFRREFNLRLNNVLAEQIDTYLKIVSGKYMLVEGQPRKIDREY